MTEEEHYMDKQNAIADEQQREEWEATRMLTREAGTGVWFSPGRLHAAIAAFQAEVGMIAKDGHNDFHRYDYATLESWVHALRPVLAKHGLAVITSCTRADELAPLKTTKGGDLRLVRVCAQARILHSSGESLELYAFGEGSDSGDKAIYKAMTGARKYLLAALSGTATSDDPEHEEPQRTKIAGRGEPRSAQGEQQRGGTTGVSPATPRPAYVDRPRDPNIPPNKISDPQRKRLWALWRKRLEVACPDITDDEAKRELTIIVKRVAGVEHSKDIDTLHYDAVVKEAEQWTPGQSEPETAPDDPNWGAT